MSKYELGETVQWSDGWPAPGAKLQTGQVVGIQDNGHVKVLSNGKIHDVIDVDLNPINPGVEFGIRTRLERMRQDEKWGEQNHAPEKWLAILMEEVGEVAKAALENSAADYEAELIQVAAVASAAFESWYRNQKRNIALLEATALDLAELQTEATDHE